MLPNDMPGKAKTKRIPNGCAVCHLAFPLAHVLPMPPISHPLPGSCRSAWSGPPARDGDQAGLDHVQAVEEGVEEGLDAGARARGREVAGLVVVA